MDFVVIDVETANPDLASICQVGIAVFDNGKFRESWSSLVNPEDYFDSYNVAIHGIDENKVVNAPRWTEVHERLKCSYSNQIVASHTPFDRTAIQRACQRATTNPFECRWLDTARVVRRTWPAFSKSGYGLANVASHLGISSSTMMQKKMHVRPERYYLEQSKKREQAHTTGALCRCDLTRPHLPQRRVKPTRMGRCTAM